MNNSINKDQNEEKILKYLFTQRFLYKKCKNIAKGILFISIIVWLLGIIPYSSEKFDQIKLVISTITTIIVFVTESISDKIKELAVDYQDYIDRSLFGLKKDKNIIPNLLKLDNKANDIIISNREDYEKSIDPDYEFTVYNWYSDVSELPLDIARIVCQNENIRWEKRQRTFYSKILIAIIILLIALTSIKIFLFKESCLNILTVVPIVAELSKIIRQNNIVSKTIDDVEEIISALYINIEEKGKKYNKRKIKEESLNIQSHIRKYRLNSVSIPEFIYKKLKFKEQKSSNDFIELKVREVLNNL